MKVEISDGKTYIPKWNGNRMQPEAEQIKINHRFLKAGERKKYFYEEPLMLDRLKGTVDSKVKLIQDLEGNARAVITGIENLIITRGKKEIKIDTAEKLYDSEIDHALIDEIELYLYLNASPGVDNDFLSEPSPST